MSNPLFKAAGITPDTKGHSAERALFDAAWECVEQLCASVNDDDTRLCCGANFYKPHAEHCPVAAFDKAATFFQEDV